MDLYRVVITDSKAGWGSRINFSLSPQDKSVVDRLGQVPSDWNFDLVVNDGLRVEQFAIKFPVLSGRILTLIL